VNYEQSNRLHVSGLPEVHSDVTHCQFDLYYDQVTNFVLDEELVFDVFLKDEKIDTLTLRVKMSELLCYYFESDKGKLYFGKQYGNFYFYSCEGDDPHLKKMFLALSTLPLSYAPQLTWKDNINNSLIMKNWQANTSSFLNSLYTDWVGTRAVYHYLDETTVKGKINNRFFGIEIETRIQLDPVARFKEITVGDYSLLQQIH